MAEYIDREKTKRELSEWCISLNSPHLLSRDDTMFLLDNIPAADVAPVVRCRDCIYTRKLYGRLVCKYGTCSGCILREDFFCANGVTRKDGDRDALD